MPNDRNASRLGTLKQSEQQLRIMLSTNDGQLRFGTNVQPMHTNTESPKHDEHKQKCSIAATIDIGHGEIKPRTRNNATMPFGHENLSRGLNQTPPETEIRDTCCEERKAKQTKNSNMHETIRHPMVSGNCGSTMTPHPPPCDIYNLHYILPCKQRKPRGKGSTCLKDRGTNERTYERPTNQPTLVLTKWNLNQNRWSGKLKPHLLDFMAGKAHHQNQAMQLVRFLEK